MINIWDLVRLKVSTEITYQVIGYVVRGNDDKRYIITDADSELLVYEEQLEKINVSEKKKAGFK